MVNVNALTPLNKQKHANKFGVFIVIKGNIMGNNVETWE